MPSIMASQDSITNSPVIGSFRRHIWLSSWPVILKLGISSRRVALSLSGVISNLIGCFWSWGAPMGFASYSTINSRVSIRSFWKNGRLMRHLRKYWLVTQVWRLNLHFHSSSLVFWSFRTRISD